MKRQVRTRRVSERLTDAGASPGPQRLHGAVDIIMSWLRRLVLQQAWERLKPTLNPTQVAQRILERQRVRLRRYASLEPQAKRSAKAIRVGNGRDAGRNYVDEDLTASPSSSCVVSSADIPRANGVDATAVRGRATGRTLFRPTMGDSKVLGVGGDGGGSGMALNYRRSRSSPALSTPGGSANSAKNEITPSKGAPCFPKTRPLTIGRAGERGEREEGSHPRSVKKGGDQSAVRSSSIVQQCFKEERASFIRDLQVLHRRLEAKDRESARREKECRAAVARARLEARSAKEQADALRAEAEKAVAARATVEATAQDLNDTVDKYSANAENLRTLLRHNERHHAEQMEFERRHQKAAAEEASAERRRLEDNVLKARKELADGRREWAEEKSLVMEAVRDAGHRAEIATGEATEAKTHAVLLEERLQQTLEREAALNAEVGALRDSVRIGGRKIARVKADACREQAAAAAQEEFFLEYAKNLQDRASRSEMLLDGEQINREELELQLDRAKEDAAANSSKTQSEMSAANLKIASLQQSLDSSRAVEEAMGRKLAATEALLADSARTSAKELEKRLNEALKERSLVEEQWRRREKDLLNLLNQAQVRKSGDCADARDSEETGLAYVMQEVEDLRGTVMRLSLEKETLLRQQSVANASCSHAREEGSRAFGMVENRKEHAKVVFKGRLTAIFRNEIGGADNVEDDAPLGVWSGGRGIESGQNEVAQRCARSSFQANLRDHRHSPGCFADDARTAAEDGRTGEGEEGEGRDGMADKGVRHVDNEDKNHRYYYECQNYRRCRRPRSGFVDIESETGDKCHSDVEETSGGCPRLEEDGELLAGKGNHCRKGWIGVNATLMHAEDEEQLAPRDGPAPVPSLLMPRHPRARPMAAPALLRVSLEEERQRRRWEHDELLALLREESVDSQREVEPDQRRLSFAEDASLRIAGRSSNQDTQGSDGKGSGARPLRHPEAEEKRSSTGEQYSSPLTSEAWRDVLAALRRSLRLRQSGPIDEGGRHSSEDVRTSGEQVKEGQWQGRAACSDIAAQASLSPERSRDACRIISRSEGNESPRSRHDSTCLREGFATDGRGGSDANVEFSRGTSDSPRGTTEQVSDGECDGDAGALTSALRELLSSTLGVSEEGVRDASLLDLIEALHRKWETLLEEMAAMQEEVDRARQLAESATAPAQTDDFISSTEGGTSAGKLSLTEPLFTSDERSKTGPSVDPDASAALRRIAELEAALEGAKRGADSVLEAEEAARRLEEPVIPISFLTDLLRRILSQTERERSDATDRLAAALRDLAAERAGGAARLESLTTELSATVASLTAAESSAATAKEEAVESQRALEHLQGEVEGLRNAVESAQRRAEVAEALVQELVTKAGKKEAVWAADVKRVRGEGWEQGRREMDQRVRALKSSLEKLAEVGSAAENISKEQLEVNRELSIERDGLAEENERITARLGELTSALREQREEKTQLAKQLSGQERGLEALRAEGDLERKKVARLHSEVEKAQAVCRDMADKLLELKTTQEELQATKEKLATVSQEIQSLRQCKDHLGAGWEEARRLRACLDGTKRLGSEMAAKVEAAEARADRASRRARHLGARADALQRQLDKVPKDLLVAHAEKRVLQAALEQEAKNAADAKAAAEAEIRRRDADIRNFASAAAVQQERCGQRLREQALTIHQLTLQGFSADARVSSPSAAARVKTTSGATTAALDVTGTDDAGRLSLDSATEGRDVSVTRDGLSTAVASAHTLRPVPRRAFFDSEDISSGTHERHGCSSNFVPGEGEGVVDQSARGVPSDGAVGVAFSSSAERRRGSYISNRPYDALENGKERRRDVWEGHALDSGFPTAKFGAPSGDEGARR